MSYYITTPIFYVNAQPHLGHAYTTIIADTISRYKRLAGEEVRFQTGTDEHGDKIAQAAAEAAITPREYVDRISALFQASWPPLAIAPDNFIRTTDANHIQTVQAILQKIYNQGDIYFGEYSGLYCQGCERFLTEKELVDGLCPDHRKAPVELTEQNYFFKMGRYQEWLIAHIQENPDFVSPERYRNEVLSFLKEPLEDLCISRPTSRLTWGIPLPFDNRYVTYVWFDALINYLSGLGYTIAGPPSPEFAKYWPVAEHVIAKDILKPHAIFWPTMLKAMGLAPYRRLHVHGYWNINGTKMSKSIGNVVRPGDLVRDYGADTVRYFLLREMVFGLDSSFSDEALIARQNSDLANDLGNLFSRSLAMVEKFAGGQVPVCGILSPSDQALAEAATAMIGKYSEQMEAFACHRALQEVWEVISLANKYIVANAPWELAKDPAKAEQLATVLYTLLETLRLISLTLVPIMPETAGKMAVALGLSAPPALQSQGGWGQGLVVARPVNAGPNLFPRLDKKELAAMSAGSKTAPTPPAKAAPGPTAPESLGADNLVSYADFQKLELRVAEIVAAMPVKKSTRLLQLTVLAPEERTIVAGIAEHYTPAELIGKLVIIVANLQPAKLMGIASHGMVLAAKDGERLVLATVLAGIAPGSRVA